jgi:transcriptional adapter 2-alpha
VIERNLLDLKKQMNFERKLSKDDRELYNCLKPFARFVNQNEFMDLFEGLVLEKNLRQRLNQLKYYK